MGINGDHSDGIWLEDENDRHCKDGQQWIYPCLLGWRKSIYDDDEEEEKHLQGRSIAFLR